MSLHKSSLGSSLESVNAHLLTDLVGLMLPSLVVVSGIDSSDEDAVAADAAGSSSLLEDSSSLGSASLEERAENFALALNYARYHSEHHKFLAPNVTQADNALQAMLDRMRTSSQLHKWRALKILKASYLAYDDQRRTERDVLDVNDGILVESEYAAIVTLLLALSRQPLRSEYHEREAAQAEAAAAKLDAWTDARKTGDIYKEQTQIDVARKALADAETEAAWGPEMCDSDSELSDWSDVGAPSPRVDGGGGSDADDDDDMRAQGTDVYASGEETLTTALTASEWLEVASIRSSEMGAFTKLDDEKSEHDARLTWRSTRELAPERFWNAPFIDVPSRVVSDEMLLRAVELLLLGHVDGTCFEEVNDDTANSTTMEAFDSIPACARLRHGVSTPRLGHAAVARLVAPFVDAIGALRCVLDLCTVQYGAGASSSGDSAQARFVGEGAAFLDDVRLANVHSTRHGRACLRHPTLAAAAQFLRASVLRLRSASRRAAEKLAAGNAPVSLLRGCAKLMPFARFATTQLFSAFRDVMNSVVDGAAAAEAGWTQESDVGYAAACALLSRLDVAAAAGDASAASSDVSFGGTAFRSRLFAASLRPTLDALDSWLSVGGSSSMVANRSPACDGVILPLLDDAATSSMVATSDERRHAAVDVAVLTELTPFRITATAGSSSLSLKREAQSGAPDAPAWLTHVAPALLRALRAAALLRRHVGDGTLDAELASEVEHVACMPPVAGRLDEALFVDDGDSDVTARDRAKTIDDDNSTGNVLVENFSESGAELAVALTAAASPGEDTSALECAWMSSAARHLREPLVTLAASNNQSRAAALIGAGGASPSLLRRIAQRLPKQASSLRRPSFSPAPVPALSDDSARGNCDLSLTGRPTWRSVVQTNVSMPLQVRGRVLDSLAARVVSSGGRLDAEERFLDELLLLRQYDALESFNEAVLAVQLTVSELRMRGDKRGARAYAERMSDVDHWQLVLTDSVNAAMSRGTLRVPAHRQASFALEPLRLTRASFDTSSPDAMPAFDIDTPVPWPVSPGVSRLSTKLGEKLCLSLLRLKRSVAVADGMLALFLKARGRPAKRTKIGDLHALRREVAHFVRCVHDHVMCWVDGTTNWAQFDDGNDGEGGSSVEALRFARDDVIHSLVVRSFCAGVELPDLWTHCVPQSRSKATTSSSRSSKGEAPPVPSDLSAACRGVGRFADDVEAASVARLWTTADGKSRTPIASDAVWRQTRDGLWLALSCADAIGRWHLSLANDEEEDQSSSSGGGGGGGSIANLAEKIRAAGARANLSRASVDGWYEKHANDSLLSKLRAMGKEFREARDRVLRLLSVKARSGGGIDVESVRSLLLRLNANGWYDDALLATTVL